MKYRRNRAIVNPVRDNSTHEDFDEKWRSYQVFYRGFKDNNVFNQMFFLIYTIRIALPMLFAVCASHSPITVGAFQLLISILT